MLHFSWLLPTFYWKVVQPIWLFSQIPNKLLAIGIRSNLRPTCKKYSAPWKPTLKELKTILERQFSRNPAELKNGDDFVAVKFYFPWPPETRKKPLFRSNHIFSGRWKSFSVPPEKNCSFQVWQQNFRPYNEIFLGHFCCRKERKRLWLLFHKSLRSCKPPIFKRAALSQVTFHAKNYIIIALLLTCCCHNKGWNMTGQQQITGVRGISLVLELCWEVNSAGQVVDEEWDGAAFETLSLCPSSFAETIIFHEIQREKKRWLKKLW